MKNSELAFLAQEFGTPLYVYDAEKIKSQYLRLQKAFDGVKNLRINYAVKALSNISIFLLSPLYFGLNVLWGTFKTRLRVS